jgi:hypothetical protein
LLQENGENNYKKGYMATDNSHLIISAWARAELIKKITRNSDKMTVKTKHKSIK